MIFKYIFTLCKRCSSTLYSKKRPRVALALCIYLYDVCLHVLVLVCVCLSRNNQQDATL